MTSTPIPAPAPVVKPGARVLRTVYMVLAAVLVAIPAATAAFGFSAATSAKLIGFAGGTTVVVTAVWNALEAAGMIPVAHATADPAAVAAVDTANALLAEPQPTGMPNAFEVALTDDEVERLADAVAKRVIVAAPVKAAARKAPAARKAARPAG